MIIARIQGRIPTVRMVVVDDGQLTASTVMQRLNLDITLWNITTTWKRELSEEPRYHGGDVITIVPREMGLLGGKGGFGAGLRAMGKGQAQAKPVIDFSLCRDLQGRRLGALNEAARAQLQRQNPHGPPVDAWVLERPSWADPVPKRNKSSQHVPSQQPPKKPISPSPPAHGDTFALEFARKVDATERSIVSAVKAGLQHQALAAATQSANVTSAAPLDESQPPVVILPEGVEILCGDVHVTLIAPDTFLLSGQSEFATIIFRNACTTSPLDHVQVSAKCITEGLVQIGLVEEHDAVSLISEQSLDGVGDVAGSWSIDAARALLWLQGTPVPYEQSEGEHWHSGDVVGYSASFDTVTFSFNHAPVSSSVKTSTKPVVAAVSIEADQVVEIVVKKSIVTQQTSATASSASSSSSGDATSQTIHSTTIPPITIEELEKLGGDYLKQELSELGLKKGGTVRERANRLYIARTTPKEEWPANLFP